MRKTVAIVVPFLNEEENLPELYSRLNTVFSGRAETVEFMFVDDGSTDGSVLYLEKIRANDPRVKILQLSRNFGHQIAITAGMDHADADAVVIIDADLQDPPEVIADLLAKWNEGFEVVYAVRRNRDGEGFLKKLLAAGFYRIFRAMCSVKVPVDAGDFRLLDRNVIEALKTMRETHRYMRGMTSWVGFRQCAVEYDRAARHAGETKYPVWKSLKLAWDGITSFSAAPLRWMTVLGVLIAFSGFIQGVRVVVGRIMHPESFEPGWATVVGLILFLTGVQLLCLGLVGQYVSRIYEESKKRPLYFLK